MFARQAKYLTSKVFDKQSEINKCLLNKQSEQLDKVIRDLVGKQRSAQRMEKRLFFCIEESGWDLSKLGNHDEESRVVESLGEKRAEDSAVKSPDAGIF